MFSGIIESVGIIEKLVPEKSNLHMFIRSPFSHELKVDQSIAHNGVCLTVVELSGDVYQVTAVKETLERTNLADCKTGDELNLERCLRAGDRIDGHIVQGHVDDIGTCTSVEDMNGSWKVHISVQAKPGQVTVEKGSICLNGISLTVVDSGPSSFSVVIIPYTWQNTNLHKLKPGDKVNLEFDIIGKYISKLMDKRG